MLDVARISKRRWNGRILTSKQWTNTLPGITPQDGIADDGWSHSVEHQGAGTEPALPAGPRHLGPPCLFTALPRPRRGGGRAVPDVRFRQLERSVGHRPRRYDRPGRPGDPRPACHPAAHL